MRTRLIALLTCILSLASCGAATPDSLQLAQVNPSQLVNSFRDCADAGYLVMKTLPAKCRTPDGRVFTDGKVGATLDVISVPVVNSFEDCVGAGNAIRRTLPASCMSADGRVFSDTSSAVRNLPTAAEVPPHVRPLNSKESACKNLCGNGTCEEIVCMAVGCPCPETAQSCPADCH